MSQPLRVAVLGLHHDHVWSHLQDVRRSSGVELAGVADPDLHLLKQARVRFACPTYADYDELLERENADIAYIFANNRMGAFLAVTAAKRGLHVMVEKPLAADLEGAEEAHRVALEEGVRLMVNWPIAWAPSIHLALTMIEAGEIGRVWQVKYRAAHAGPRELGCSDSFCHWLFDAKLNGGGALIDYACYGCALARVVLGVPDSVQATMGNYVKTSLPVEDNATVLAAYPRASAIAEASWTQQGQMTSYEALFYGEEGTLAATILNQEKLLRADENHPDGEEIELENSEGHLNSSSRHHLRHATAYFTWAITNDQPLMPLVSSKVGRDTQAILTAAQAAACLSGTPVKQYADN